MTVFCCIKVLFSKQKKQLPSILRKIPGGDCLRFGFFVAVMSWILQGLRYMNWREAVLKMMLDAVMTAVLWFVGLPLLFAWVISHSINFCLNGQMLAMFTHFGAGNMTSERFFRLTEKLTANLQMCGCLQYALVFGSLARGEYRRTSDIDLRLIPMPGEANSWYCAFYALKLRIICFFLGYPLDLYMFDLQEVTRKMRTDEPPVILCGNPEALVKIYPETVSFQKFSQLFTEKQLKRGEC